MFAWQLSRLGEPADVLDLVEVPDPDPRPGHVIVRVEAAALNFADVLLCRGEYQVKPPLPFSPGLEIAGRVIGDDPAQPGRIGRRVLAQPSFPFGGLRSTTLVRSDHLLDIADHVDAAQAASMLITYQTAWFGLTHRAKLKDSDTLLVHAGAGGAGSAAIQLGLAAGARVIATAGGPEKVGVCRKLGAHECIDYRSTDFVEAVRDFTDGRGADVIFDPVGADTFEQSRRCIAWEGRHLVIGFAGGRIPDLGANHLLLKNYDVIGVHHGRYIEHDPALVQRCHRELMAMLDAKTVRPLIGGIHPMEAVPDVLTKLGARGTIGKLVITI